MNSNRRYFDDLCKRGMEASRIGAEKRKQMIFSEPALKEIPQEIIKAHLPKPTGKSYMKRTRGGWDVYKDGEYFDTFDTKGAAWRAL